LATDEGNRHYDKCVYTGLKKDLQDGEPEDIRKREETNGKRYI
jgi:hypothetical protein